MSLPIAQICLPAGSFTADATITLDYEARFLRRKRIETDEGWALLVDLEQATSLNHGDGLQLDDGRIVVVYAASEALFEVRGTNLAKLAWHIGNRHTPCQIMQDHVRIRADKVIAHMLSHLDAEITETLAPFSPEGGAYGHGRTHSHDHGASTHVH